MPSFTLTVSNAEAARIAKAFGLYWQLNRDATAAEVKEYLVRQLRGVVRNVERAAAEASISIGDVIVT